MSYEDNRQLEDLIERKIREQIGGGLFTLRKTTDTPPDSLSVVNRQYVNLNGTVAARPSVALTGQRYFATDTKIPMTYTGTNWVNGVGSVVASS